MTLMIIQQDLHLCNNEIDVTVFYDLLIDLYYINYIIVHKKVIF